MRVVDTSDGRMAAATDSAEASEADPTRGRARRFPPSTPRGLVGLGVSTLGFGGLGIAIGHALAMQSDERERDEINQCSVDVSCSDDDEARILKLTDSASDKAKVANGFAIGSAVLVAVGAVLMATAPPHRESRTALRPQPWLCADAGGMSLSGQW
jgi:hypothetical protein